MRAGPGAAWATCSWLLSLVLVTASCSPVPDAGAPLDSSRDAILAGAPAPDDTGVVAVVNFAGGQCSGSLISGNLVLSARHCVADAGNADAPVVCGQTRFEPPDSAGAIFVVTQASITEDKQDYLPVAEVLMPEGVGDELCGTDITLLRLKDWQSEVAPLTPRLDPPALVGEAYAAVGYGIDESLPDKPSGERKRRDGLSVRCVGDECRDSGVEPREWMGDGGPCHGDSGGPALDSGGHILGVVSRGAAGCTQPVFSDIASRADWLKASAIEAANTARKPPPAWAPCDERSPCLDLTAQAGPAETCTISRAPAGNGAKLWIGAASLLLRRLKRRARSALRPGPTSLGAR